MFYPERNGNSIFDIILMVALGEECGGRFDVNDCINIRLKHFQARSFNSFWGADEFKKAYITIVVYYSVCYPIYQVVNIRPLIPGKLLHFGFCKI